MSGLWSRLNRVLGADAHAARDGGEEPHGMLNQLLRELVEAATEARLGARRAKDWRGQLEHQQETYRADMEDAASAARHAMERGDEALARAAIGRRQHREHALRATRRQLEQADQLVKRFDQRRAQLADELAALREQRASLAQGSRLQRTVSALRADSVLAKPKAQVDARMQDKVIAREALADCLLDPPDEAPPDADEFIASEAIDAELEALAKRIRH